MFTNACNQHESRISANASTRVDMFSTLGMATAWLFTAKPYAHQRPSGAPPG